MITIQKVEINQLDALLKFSKKTFYDFFARFKRAANMEAYPGWRLSRRKICCDNWQTPIPIFIFAQIGDEIAGYLMVYFNDAQTELRTKTRSKLSVFMYRPSTTDNKLVNKAFKLRH